jgi:general secretion pathway protein H
MAVVALVASLAVPAVEGMTGANARKAAGELAGSMRALFDTAALRHATCRMVLDLDKRAYWAECAKGRAGMAAGDAREPDDRTLEERFPDEKDADVRRILAKSAFGQFQDRLVQKRELPGRAGFGPVHVEGQRDATESGTAYVYFFAGGQAQRAYVPVVDGKNLYTIVLEPFTGRARVVPGKVEVRE